MFRVRNLFLLAAAFIFVVATKSSMDAQSLSLETNNIETSPREISLNENIYVHVRAYGLYQNSPRIDKRIRSLEYEVVYHGTTGDSNEVVISDSVQIPYSAASYYREFLNQLFVADAVGHYEVKAAASIDGYDNYKKTIDLFVPGPPVIQDIVYPLSTGRAYATDSIEIGFIARDPNRDLVSARIEVASSIDSTWTTLYEATTESEEDKSSLECKYVWRPEAPEEGPVTYAFRFITEDEKGWAAVEEESLAQVTVFEARVEPTFGASWSPVGHINLEKTFDAQAIDRDSDMERFSILLRAEGEEEWEVLKEHEAASDEDRGSILLSQDWTPTEAGSYEIQLKADDALHGTVYSDIYRIQVYENYQSPVPFGLNVPRYYRLSENNTVPVSIGFSVYDADFDLSQMNIEWTRLVEDGNDVTGLLTPIDHENPDTDGIYRGEWTWMPGVPGTYTIKCLASDSEGNSETDANVYLTREIEVRDPIEPVPLHIEAPAFAVVNNAVEVSASARDEDGVLSSLVLGWREAGETASGEITWLGERAVEGAFAEATWSWTPTTTGTFELESKVVDLDGLHNGLSEAYVRNEIEVLPSNPPEVLSVEVIGNHEHSVEVGAWNLARLNATARDVNGNLAGIRFGWRDKSSGPADWNWLPDIPVTALENETVAKGVFWTLEEEGTFLIRCVAYDEQGVESIYGTGFETAELKVSRRDTRSEAVSLEVSSRYAAVGETIVFTGAAFDPDSRLNQLELTYDNRDETLGIVEVEGSYAEASWSWTPTAVGNYRFQLVPNPIVDGLYHSDYVDVSVGWPHMPKPIELDVPPTLVKDEPVEIRLTAEDGDGNLESLQIAWKYYSSASLVPGYTLAPEYAYYDVPMSDMLPAKTVSGDNATAVWEWTPPYGQNHGGVYLFKAIATDSAGNDQTDGYNNLFTKSVAFTTRSAKVDAVIVPGEVEVDKPVEVKALVSHDQPYLLNARMAWRKKQLGSDEETFTWLSDVDVSGYSDEAMWTWIPDEPGEYEIRVLAKAGGADLDSETGAKYFDYPVLEYTDVVVTPESLGNERTIDIISDIGGLYVIDYEEPGEPLNLDFSIAGPEVNIPYFRVMVNGRGWYNYAEELGYTTEGNPIYRIPLDLKHPRFESLTSQNPWEHVNIEVRTHPRSDVSPEGKNVVEFIRALKDEGRQAYTLEAPDQLKDEIVDNYEGPASHIGTTIEELISLSDSDYQLSVTDPVSFSPENEEEREEYDAFFAATSQNDLSPENMRHPKLDEFIARMNYDPIVLTNWVFNEISLDDTFDSLGSGGTGAGLYSTGLRQNAFSTFLRREGNPIEQCALLIYFLRGCGLNACYAAGPLDSLKLNESQLERYLGLVLEDVDSDSHLTNVQYPWVVIVDGIKEDPAANSTVEYIHLFPWLKNIRIEEGLSFMDLIHSAEGSDDSESFREFMTELGYDTPEGRHEMPPYFSEYVFENYLQDDSGLSYQDFLVGTIEDVLQRSGLDVGIDKFGRRKVNQTINRQSWDEFPMPFVSDAPGGGVVLKENLNDPNILGIISRVDLKFANATDLEIEKNFSGLALCNLLDRNLTVHFEQIEDDRYVCLTLDGFSDEDSEEYDRAADQSLDDLELYSSLPHWTEGNEEWRAKSRERFPDLGFTSKTDSMFWSAKVWGYHIVEEGISMDANLWDRYSGLEQKYILMGNGSNVYGVDRLFSIYIDSGNGGIKGNTNYHVERYEKVWQRIRNFKEFKRVSHLDAYGAMSHLLGVTYNNRLNRFDEFQSDFYGYEFDKSVSVGAFGFNGAESVDNSFSYVSPFMDVLVSVEAILQTARGSSSADISGYEYDTIDRDFYDMVLNYLLNSSYLEGDAIKSFFGYDFGISTVHIIKGLLAEGTPVRKYEVIDGVAYVDGEEIEGGIDSIRNPEYSISGSVADFLSESPTQGRRVTYLPDESWQLKGLNGQDKPFQGAMAIKDNGLGQALISYDGFTTFGGAGIENESFVQTAYDMGGGGFIEQYDNGHDFSYGVATSGLSDAYVNEFINILEDAYWEEHKVDVVGVAGELYRSGALNEDEIDGFLYDRLRDFNMDTKARLEEDMLWAELIVLGEMLEDSELIAGVKQAGGIHEVEFIDDNTGYLNVFAIQLAVLDYGNLGEGIGELSLTGDPVNVTTGDFYENVVDLQIPGSIPFSVSRNYSSANLARNSFGHGWKMNFMPYITFKGDDQRSIYAAGLDGAVHEYVEKDPGSGIYELTAENNPYVSNTHGLGSGVDVNPFQNYIEKSVVGGEEYYQLNHANGSAMVYKVMEFPFTTYDGDDGEKHVILRRRPYLVEWLSPALGNAADADRNRNKLFFTYYDSEENDTGYGDLKEIKSSVGESIFFNYNNNKVITSIESSDGRSVIYDYDEFGDLSTVLYDDGRFVKYEYGKTTENWTVRGESVDVELSNHLLTEKIEPNGRRLINEYDEDRRVRFQRSTAGQDLTPVLIAEYEYDPNGDEVIVKGNYDAEAESFESETTYHIADNQVYKITGPMGYEIEQDWTTTAVNGQRLLQSFTNKRGVVTSFEYDDLGNTLRMTESGDLNGNESSDSLVWEYSYLKDGPLDVGVSPRFAAEQDVVGLRGNLVRSIKSPNGDVEIMHYRPLGSTDASTSYSVFGTETHADGAVKVNSYGYEDKSLSIDVSTESGSIERDIDVFGLQNTVSKAVDVPDQLQVTEMSYDVRGYVSSVKSTVSNLDGQESIRQIDTVRDKRGQMVAQTSRATAWGLGEGSLETLSQSRSQYDVAGRPVLKRFLDADGDVLYRQESRNYNLNGELEWIDGPIESVGDYVFRDYDAAGRLIAEVAWRSKAKEDGTGMEPVAAYVEGEDDFQNQELFSATYYYYDSFGNLTDIVNPDGGAVRMSYNQLGQMTSRRTYSSLDLDEVEGSAAVSEEFFSYEAGGEISEYTNPNGGITRFFYDSFGNLIREERPDGTEVGFYYDQAHRIVEQYDIDGNVTEIDFSQPSDGDENHFYRTTTLKTQSTLGYEVVVKEVFDLHRNLVKRVDAEGNVFTYEYDEQNRVLRSSGPEDSADGRTLQQITEYEYSFEDDQFVNRATLANGDVAEQVMDPLGRPIIARTYKEGSNTDFTYSRTVYPELHLSGGTTPAGGQDFDWVRSEIGGGDGYEKLEKTVYFNTFNQTALTVVDDKYTRTVFDKSGRPVEFIDEIGRTTKSEYDELGRLGKSYTPTLNTNSLAFTEYDYDAAGNLTAMSMPGGTIWRAEYDIANRMTKEALHSGAAKTREYEYSYYDGEQGNRLHRSSNPRGFDVSYLYDAVGRPLSVDAGEEEDPGYVKSEYTYGDKRGFATQILQTTNSHSEGATRRFWQTRITRDYDSYGQLGLEKVELRHDQSTFVTQSAFEQSWDSAGRRSRLDWGDDASHLAETEEPGYAFTYRPNGSLWTAQGPGMSNAFSYSYTQAGMLKSRYSQIAVGVEIDVSIPTNGIDARGRTTRINRDYFGTQLNEILGYQDDSKINAYSRSGRRAVDGLQFFYDNERGQLTRTTSQNAAQYPASDYTFDHGSTAEQNNIGALTSISSNGETLSSIPSGGLNAFKQATDMDLGSGLLLKEVLANGSLDVQTGVPGSLLKEGAEEAGFEVAEGVKAEIDGQVYAQADLEEMDLPSDQSWQHPLRLPEGTHELEIELTDEEGEGLTDSAASVDFTVSIDETASFDDEFDAEGNLIRRVLDGEQAFPNGFTTAGGTQTLTWDNLGRLSKVVYEDLIDGTKGYTFEAIYDGFGRRISTRYTDYHQGFTLNKESKVDSAFDPQVEFLEVYNKTNDDVSWKLYGPDAYGVYGGLQGVGGLEAVYEEKSSKTLYAMTDYWGNIQGWIDSASDIVETTPVYEYGPRAGEANPSLEESGSLVSSLNWQGRRTDPTGYMWMGARYYDAKGARFISADPLGHSATPDLYSYAGGDPINLLDPSGRVPETFSGDLIEEYSPVEGNASLSRGANQEEERGAWGSALYGFTSTFTDIWDMVSDPVSTYNDLKDVYQMIREDPWGMLEALGDDLKRQFTTSDGLAELGGAAVADAIIGAMSGGAVLVPKIIKAAKRLKKLKGERVKTLDEIELSGVGPKFSSDSTFNTGRGKIHASVKAKALLEDAYGGDVGDIVDFISQGGEKNYFNVIGNTRIINLTDDVVAGGVNNQMALKIIFHELGHGQVFKRALDSFDGNMKEAWQFVNARSKYAREEVLVEKLARYKLMDRVGDDLDPRVMQHSRDYVDGWKEDDYYNRHNTLKPKQ